MKPYVVLCSFDTHGYDTLHPIYKHITQNEDIDVTLLLPANTAAYCFQDCHSKKEIRKGLKGKDYRLGNILVARKPSVVVGFRLWWDPDRVFGAHARANNIPVVMVNHGAMFVYNKAQTYKRSLGPADVNCVWGRHDYNLWKKWTKDKIVITGNPLHDKLIKYKPEPIKTPKEYVLLLTPRDKRKVINKSAELINKTYPVVAKCHPIDKEKDYYRSRYLTYDEPWTLLPLIYKAKFIITNVSSALIPALYWKKPIFICSFGAKGYHFEEFKNQFKNKTFNFKETAKWSKEELYSPIVPTMDDYTHFGHFPDGKNTKRVVEVIKSYV